MLTSFLFVCNDKASSPTPVSSVTGATCGFPGQPAHGRISNQTSSLLLPYSLQTLSSLTSYLDSSSYSSDPAETSSTSSYNEGDYVYFQCDPGYYMKGRTSRRCLPNGIWSGDLPICGQYIRWAEAKILSCIRDVGPVAFFSSSITLSVRAILCYSFICESCPSPLVLSSCFLSSSSCSVWVSLWFHLLPFLVHVLRFIRSQKWSLEIQEWKKCHSYQSDRSGGWTKEGPFIASFLMREVIISSIFSVLFLTTFHDFLSFTSCVCDLK